MSFRKYVRQLTQLRIIASKIVRIEEATRGRHLEITLLVIPILKLLELLEDILQRKLPMIKSCSYSVYKRKRQN